jgi:hypothetical protein
MCIGFVGNVDIPSRSLNAMGIVIGHKDMKVFFLGDDPLRKKRMKECKKG